MKAAIVYTMGKVGSDALARGLDAAGVPNHHIHTLNTEYILRQVEKAVSADSLPAAHLCASMLLLRRLPASAVYVSSVRDPVARNLSAFFQNLAAFGLNENSGIEQVRDVFLTRYKHKLPLRWFDREFTQYTGLDVFENPFDKEKRYVKGASWIVFRDDCADTEKGRQLSTLVGEKVVVKRLNLTGEKAEKELYARAKNELKLPERLLEEIYDSPFVAYFWTPQERDAMFKRWR